VAAHRLRRETLFYQREGFRIFKDTGGNRKNRGYQVLDDMVYLIRDFRPTSSSILGRRARRSRTHQAAGILTPRAVQLAADDRTKQKRVVRIAGPGRRRSADLGAAATTAGLRPSSGRNFFRVRTHWRQLGIDAFANHRTQGSLCLGSTFLQRPIAVHREDGKAFRCKIIAVTVAGRFKGCTPIELGGPDLESSRGAVCNSLEACRRKNQPCGSFVG